jgi:predicted RNase H-like HicB family nuclease
LKETHILNLPRFSGGKPKRQVVLIPAEEGGFTVIVPSLPRCISEGDTGAEALENIKDAINLYIESLEAHGYLDPKRNDPRIFFDDSAPPDPFTTNRERALAGPQYSIGAVTANGESFLDVMKTWDTDGYQRMVIPQPDWDTAYETVEVAHDMIDRSDLQSAMRLVERAGIEAGVIDPEREDPRLFTQGPLDSFVTVREEEIDEDLARHGVTWREVHEWGQAAEVETAEVSRLYWHFDTLPVNDPDGQPLGYALHMVVYEGVEHNLEAVGSPAIPDDKPFRMLEVAHFQTIEAADRFVKEFNGYLLPGVLDGPELAEEVAKLEGHPSEWKT